MRAFGFSTGALAKSDVRRALGVAAQHDTGAVEYSALRLGELVSMVTFLEANGPGDFQYISFHAPSRFSAEEEPAVVALLRRLVARRPMHIVVHPDVICNHSLWTVFGEYLCIENMDHRKPIGRTADELGDVFSKLPNARLCFDIGHAHEIDRSMTRGYEILRRYRNRIAHVHASEVSDECDHRAFSASSHAAFLKVSGMIPESVPVILETDVPESRVGGQLEEARTIFERNLWRKGRTCRHEG